ncbi:CNP1-like family protein [Polaromonas sp. YR568]|uniref:CNP1-like family protein n=1 Tax=Polaromonas sp. YR568 TaxID=1855301 RepID=UPI0031382852
MKIKLASLAACVWLACMTGAAFAQPTSDDPEWKESEAPPPPAFDMGKVLPFDVSINSALTYGVDPASITISPSDGIVRYVVVATSASGARNVMYEAIRCATGEFKTYARYTPDNKWVPVAKAEWRSMFDNMPSRHPLRFARVAACDNAAPVSTVAQMVYRLKNPALVNSR